jgi:hypothetical protein
VTTDVSESRATLSPDQLLTDLIRAHPQVRAVFDRHGLHGCGGRLGPYKSIHFFARARGVDEARLLAKLQETIARPVTVPAAMPAPRSTRRSPAVSSSLPVRRTLAHRVTVDRAAELLGADRNELLAALNEAIAACRRPLASFTVIESPGRCPGQPQGASQ